MPDLPISTSSAESSAIGTTHPLYATWAPVWRKLAHVYEGSGGFLDGSYLQPHPREWEDHSSPILGGDDGKTIVGYQTNPNPSKPTAKLKERRRLARYENISASIIDHKIAALFRQPPVRSVKGEGSHAWLDWCDDIDTQGLGLTDYLHDSMVVSMVFGHSITVMDRPSSAQKPRTQADVKPPYLRCYTPLDMPDWLDDDMGRLTAVKLLEATPRASLKSPVVTGVARVRILTGDGWETLDESKSRSGKVTMQSVAEGLHGFGRLPAVVLYAQRRALIPVIGKSVLYDPQLYIDHYNLTSELRELFRKQVFSFLNVPLGSGQDRMDVEEAKRLMGNMVGAMNVVFSGLPIDFVSPDSGNVTSYQTEIARLIRMIYRLCNVPWEADSKDAESEGSLKLKREDMNQILSGYADKLERAEYEIAELWFRATYGPAQWEREWESAEPTISYSRNFDPTPFAELLEQAQAALALPLGQSKTFLMELCKLLMPLFLPNLPESTRATISEELENLPDPAEARQATLNRLAASFAQTPESGAKVAAEQQIRDDEPKPAVAA